MFGNYYFFVVVLKVWKGTNGFWQEEARDAAKHHIMHRTVLTTQNYLAQNDNSVEILGVANSTGLYMILNSTVLEQEATNIFSKKSEANILRLVGDIQVLLHTAYFYYLLKT